MVRIFREYRNAVVKYKQFPSHLKKKKFFPCDRNVLVFSENKKKPVFFLLFFFFFFFFTSYLFNSIK